MVDRALHHNMPRRKVFAACFPRWWPHADATAIGKWLLTLTRKLKSWRSGRRAETFIGSEVLGRFDSVVIKPSLSRLCNHTKETHALAALVAEPCSHVQISNLVLFASRWITKYIMTSSSSQSCYRMFTWMRHRRVKQIFRLHLCCKTCRGSRTYRLSFNLDVVNEAMNEAEHWSKNDNRLQDSAQLYNSAADIYLAKAADSAHKQSRGWIWGVFPSVAYPILDAIWQRGYSRHSSHPACPMHGLVLCRFATLKICIRRLPDMTRKWILPVLKCNDCLLYAICISWGLQPRFLSVREATNNTAI